MKKMFKVLQLEFFNHPFFGNLELNFVDSNEHDAESYTSLIIGPNGTGKSKILLSLIDIFNSLKNHNLKKYEFNFEYRIIYINNSKKYDVQYKNVSEVIRKDYKLYLNDSIYRDEDFGLPSKILISAFSFNDKYPLRENRGRVLNEDYHYLGLKSTTNNIFISKPIRDALTNLNHAIKKGKNIEPLRQIFSELDLVPEVKIIYKYGRNYVFPINRILLRNQLNIQRILSIYF